MVARRGLEGLGGDVDGHVHDDRRQHRQRQPLHQPGDDAEHAADADEQAGQQRIAAARAHVLTPATSVATASTSRMSRVR
ncbi:hypothetical protein G6F55_014411 [Rhizopus delemar]|nr:hypothetical protein G6F23_015872 [Rhizopus arrhizus]KAG1435100.1 hypothetical protein G6F55_014411 [Rhizopus delemar]